MPFYLRPSAPTAADALICGDPARALAIAQRVMVQPRMSNHNRGLWGYHGETPEGQPISVQATGIGGPSAVAVLEESIALGVRRMIRIGTCVGVDTGPGEALVVAHAVADDGASRHLGAAPGEIVDPDAELTRRLLDATGASGATVRSGDVMPVADALGRAAADGGARFADLQSAAVLTLGRRHGLTVAAALVVRELDGRRLHDDPLEASLLRLADAAVTALQH